MLQQNWAVVTPKPFFLKLYNILAFISRNDPLGSKSNTNEHLQNFNKNEPTKSNIPVAVPTTDELINNPMIRGLNTVNISETKWA